MSNEVAYAALAQMVTTLNAIGSSSIANEIAIEAAPLVQEAVRASAAQGVDPDGTPWAPKKDGTKALVGVEANITCKPIGPMIQITLTGGAVYHHFANGKKTRIQRRVLPDGGAGVPANIAEAITKAAARVMARKTGGR